MLNHAPTGPDMGNIRTIYRLGTTHFHPMLALALPKLDQARFTRSFQSLERNSTRDRAVAMRRLSACTNVDGMDARRRMELLTT